MKTKYWHCSVLSFKAIMQVLEHLLAQTQKVPVQQWLSSMQNTVYFSYKNTYCWFFLFWGYGAGAGVTNGYGAKPNGKSTLFFSLNIGVCKMFTVEHYADDNWCPLQIRSLWTRRNDCRPDGGDILCHCVGYSASAGGHSNGGGAKANTPGNWLIDQLSYPVVSSLSEHTAESSGWNISISTVVILYFYLFSLLCYEGKEINEVLFIQRLRSRRLHYAWTQ